MSVGVCRCLSVAGVQRTHLISRHDDGSLLLELFTRDGNGMLVCRDIYDGIRVAKPRDLEALVRAAAATRCCCVPAAR